MSDTTRPGDDETTWAADDDTRPSVASDHDGGLPRGTTIGRYVVMARLGAGGMGVVYAAVDPELDRKVAIKLVHPGAEGSTDSTRLLREAQAMARLDHPNVVTVHDVGRHGDDVYIAMEYVPGRTLTRWTKERARSWREVLALLLQAGEGLVAAHDKGVVHRDFKPDNVMVTDEGTPHVMDFGLARGTDARAETTEEIAQSRSSLGSNDGLTRTGAVMGTPRYMSAEQFAGLPADPRSDQFAFCVTLWEALYGQRPFGGDSFAALVAAVAAGRIEPPPRDARVPSWLRTAVERGLDPEPERRWPSMRALLTALRDDPTRRRRRVVWAGVAAGAIAAGFGVKAWRAQESEAQCMSAGREIDAVWNPDVAARLEAALESSGLALAPATAEKTTQVLDAYADAWSRARADACRSQRSSPDDPIHGARIECLDERAQAAERLLARIGEQPSPAIIVRLVLAARDLPAIHDCNDDARLASGPERPDDPATIEAIAQTRVDLGEAATARALGQFEEGLAAARRADERATAIDWLPLRAETSFTLGTFLAETGDYEASLRTLDAAEFRAANVGDERLVLEAKLLRMSVLGEDLHRFDEALRVGDLVEEALVEQGLEASEQAARWNNDVGLCKQALARYDEAAAHYVEAIRLWETSLGADDPHVGIGWANLGTLEDARGRFGESAAAHLRSIAIWEASVGPQHPRIARSLQNYASAKYSLGAFAEARALFEQAIATLEQSLGRDHPDLAQLHANLGSVAYMQHDLPTAIASFRHAIELAEAKLGPDDPFLVQPLGNLATIHLDRGEVADARQSFTRAAAILEKAFGPDHPSLAFPLNGLADLSRRTGELDEAIRLFERAIGVLEKAHGPDHPDLGHPLTNLALVKLEQGAHADAAALARRAIAVFSKAMGPDHPVLAPPLNALGDAELALGNLDAAVEHYERALQIRQTKLAPDDPKIASSSFTLAQALWRRPADRERAIELARSAATLLCKAGPDRAKQCAEIEAWLAAR